ncbi:hypothetical protein [Fictibacillus sp. BK138]|uniref:hypothetical protein n=1 Tax=Fictibacillus sp. BK138 TaxID=2512121 RepID=UPI001029E055|nr:hypothetical protein [Fictibacillus sp. BK138]RZT22914.1 hypothetical protein EV282_1999 [Fictibacillus sp. BK138]
MSLKLIELQVAIPRTMDAGKTAAELAQKGMIQQAHLIDQDRKKQITESKKVSAKERTDNSTLHTGENNTSKSTQRSAMHPFKGQEIDYSG